MEIIPKIIKWEVSEHKSDTFYGIVEGVDRYPFEIRIERKKKVKDIIKVFQYSFGLEPHANNYKKIKELRVEDENSLLIAQAFCQDVFDNLVNSLIQYIE